MRLFRFLAPVLLILGGAGYFIAKSRPTTGMAPIEVRPAPIAPASAADEADRLADVQDAIIVRDSLQNRVLTTAEKNNMVAAAGRRYMRRKLAYARAKLDVGAGKATPESIEPLQEEMKLAREVCDLAESLGSPHHVLDTSAWELERRFAYGGASVALVDRFSGSSAFTESDLQRMEKAFLARFGRPLPVSARGSGAVHHAMGLDHRGRFDLAISPQNPEGVWVRNYLSTRNVSYFAFRSAARGRSTGAHIHIGPASNRRLPGD
jgi:hypothetical protein